MQRPRVTPEIIEQAAQTLAKENGWSVTQAADIAKAYRANMDGYELAKELERVFLWDISVDDVETLDCMTDEVRRIHRDACHDWARENNIQPPLPIGTMTTIGEITGIYEHDAACYLIRANGDTNESRRQIVRFEDARAVPTGAAC